MRSLSHHRGSSSRRVIIAPATRHIEGCPRRMRLPRRILVAVLFAVLIFTYSAWGDTWTDAAHTLARDIATKTGPGAIALRFQNLSSLSAADAAQVRRSVEAELRTSGVEVVPSDRAVAEVDLTLSENARGYLWVADIHQGNAREVAMLTVPRAGASSGARPAAAMTVQKKLLWRQDEPILDVASIEDRGGAGAGILVLEPNRISLYRSLGGRWQLQQQQPLVTSSAWSRDRRGRVALRPDQVTFDAWLPATVCAGTVQPSLSITCHGSDDPWPLQPGEPNAGSAFFGSSRNFFTGVLVAANGQHRNLPPFFSAAPVPNNGTTSWLFAGVDGRARWLPDSASTSTVELPDRWGSELASVSSSCGSRNQVIVTSDGDFSEVDAVEALELVDRDFVAASAPLEFVGPVTALWSEPGGQSVTALVRNLQAGNYEAYALSIACGQ